jgi:hypothetical protein
MPYLNVVFYTVQVFFANDMEPETANYITPNLKSIGELRAEILFKLSIPIAERWNHNRCDVGFPELSRLMVDEE